MQFLMVAHDLITDVNITSNEFRIYTYLMSLYNSTQDCSFPSMETIVEKLGITKPTVNKSIKKLVELGYMTIEKQKAKIGNFNKYKGFKHLITKKETKVETPAPIDSNGKAPVDGQVHFSEVVEDVNTPVEKVEILTSAERRAKDKENSIPVRIARKYTEVDGNGYAIEVLSQLDADVVESAGYKFKDQLELGKLKKNCISNFLRVVVDEYYKAGVEFPTRVYKLLSKYQYVTRTVAEAKDDMVSEESEMYVDMEETSEEYMERMNLENPIQETFVETKLAIDEEPTVFTMNGIAIGA